MSRTMEIALKLTGNQAEVKAIGDLLRGVGASASAASPDVANLEKEIEKLKNQLDELKHKHEEVNEGAKEFQDTMRETAEAPLRTFNREIIHLLNGMGGVGVVFASAAVGVGLVAAGMLELVKSQAEAAEKIGALSIQMGLSVQETGKLSAIAKIAGVDIQALHGSARFLAAALEDEAGQGKRAAEALQKMGIATREFGGETRAIGSVFTELIDKLSQIESTSQRVFEAQRVLPRGAANEVLVLAERLREAREEYDKMGVKFDENVNAKLEKAAIKINAMGVAWDLFKAKVAEGIAPVVIKVFTALTPGDSSHAGPQGMAKDSAFRGLGINEITNADVAAGTSAGLMRSAAQSAAELEMSARAKNIERGNAAADAFAKNQNKNIDSMKKALEEGKKTEATALAAATAHGVGEFAHQKAVKEYNDVVAANQKLEASIKQAERYKTAQEQFADKLLEAQKANQSVFGKIELERQELISKEGYSAKQASQLTAPKVQEEISKLLGDNVMQLARGIGPRSGDASIGGTVGKKIAEIVKANNEQAIRDMKVSNDAFEKDLKDQEKGLVSESKSLDEQFKAFLELDKARAQNAAGVELARRQRVRAATRVPGQETTSTDIKSDLALQIGLAKQLAQIETDAANAKLNSEAAAINNVREQIGNEEANRQMEELSLKNQADLVMIRAKLEIDIENQRIDAENKIADLQAKNLKEYHDAAGRVFDALKGGGKSIQSFFQEFAMGQAKTVFSNLMAPIFQSVGVGLGKSTNPLLAGTIFGSKDVAQANPPVDKNTSALQDATTATNKLTGALTGSSVGGTSAPSASSTSGLIGALQTNTDSTTSMVDAITGGGDQTGSGEAGIEGIGTPGGTTTYGDDAAGGSSGGLGLLSKILGVGGAAGGAAGGFLSKLGGAISGKSGGGPLQTLMDPNASDSSKVMAGIGAAGAVAAGVSGVMGGIRQGGAQGALNATSSVLGTAAALDPEPISKAALAIAALGTKLIGGLFGDPKANRDRAITAELRDAQYNQPDPLSLQINSNGTLEGSDFRGRLRSLNALPQLSYFEKAIGFDPLHPQNVIGAPERMISPGTPVPPTVVQVSVQTMDSKSFMDNSKNIADAARKAMQEGHPIRQSITNLTRPF